MPNQTIRDIASNLGIDPDGLNQEWQPAQDAADYSRLRCPLDKIIDPRVLPGDPAPDAGSNAPS